MSSDREVFDAFSNRVEELVASLPVAYQDTTISLVGLEEKFHFEGWNALTIRKGKSRELYLSIVDSNVEGAKKLHISEWGIYLRMAVLTSNIVGRLSKEILRQNELTVSMIQSYIKETDDYITLVNFDPRAEK